MLHKCKHACGKHASLRRTYNSCLHNIFNGPVQLSSDSTGLQKERINNIADASLLQPHVSGLYAAAWINKNNKKGIYNRVGAFYGATEPGGWASRTSTYPCLPTEISTRPYDFLRSQTRTHGAWQSVIYIVGDWADSKGVKLVLLGDRGQQSAKLSVFHQMHVSIFAHESASVLCKLDYSIIA